MWKGRRYQFDALQQSDAPGVRWATGLVVARLLIAALLLWSGGSGEPLPVAAALLLLGWTVAVLEQLTRKGIESRWSTYVDVAGGFACLGYLQLSGSLLLLPTLVVVLLLAICARWFPWQAVATMALVLPGVILLIVAETQTPNTILLGWLVAMTLVASRSVVQVVIPWLQRFRSS